MVYRSVCGRCYGDVESYAEVYVAVCVLRNVSVRGVPCVVVCLVQF